MADYLDAEAMLEILGVLGDDGQLAVAQNQIANADTHPELTGEQSRHPPLGHDQDPAGNTAGVDAEESGPIINASDIRHEVTGEQFPNLPTGHEQDPMGDAADVTGGVSGLTITEGAPTPPTEIFEYCVICFGKVDIGNTNNFLRPPCGDYYCITCSRSLFSAACGDETLVPLRCCSVEFDLTDTKHIIAIVGKELFNRFQDKTVEYATVYRDLLQQQTVLRLSPPSDHQRNNRTMPRLQTPDLLILQAPRSLGWLHQR